MKLKVSDSLNERSICTRDLARYFGPFYVYLQLAVGTLISKDSKRLTTDFAASAAHRVCVLGTPQPIHLRT